MTQGVPQPEAMSAEQAACLAEFARAAKAAARAVTLYPGTHPAIQAALGRVVATASKLAAAGDVTLAVEPDRITIDGRAAAKPDLAIGELADLLHSRLVGSLRIEREADAADWLAFLLILSKSTDDLVAQGGVAKAWGLVNRAHFEIREIDYAEVLRERGGGELAEWDRIIANCLQGDTVDLDEATLTQLLELTGDPERFGDFLTRLQDAGGADTKVGARAAALLRIIRGLIDHVNKQSPDGLDAMLRSVAQATSKLTPDMMLAMLSQRDLGTGEGEMVGAIVDRMNERTIAKFVAGNIVAERGATGRLAQAFEALVPDTAQREAVLDAAREDVAQSELGAESGFEELWQNAASMLMNYSDKPYVSAEYARELSEAKTQAIEVDRVSDDPPERVQGWLASVSEDSVRHLDLLLLLDLLRLEHDHVQWRGISTLVTSQIERLTLLGDARGARQLLEPITREAGPEGREAFRAEAALALERLSAGPLVRHVVLHLRKVEDREVEPFAALCHTLGASVVRPLAESLASEENNRAVRRLRELLVSYGAAGRQAVEQLKNSRNPAVRRTAIDLLRVFGGSEALPELASMLDDADPQVQRDSIRAIVQIATEEAYAVLERALQGGSRETILEQLISLRDDKAIPLLCYVLNHTRPRGRMVNAHLGIIDALGSLSEHPQSTSTLKTMLYSGNWWAPFRTAALRHAAAIALRRVGGPEAAAVLEDAAANGTRAIRNIARTQVGMVRTGPPRERVKS
jgi:HEAT repeat protein